MDKKIATTLSDEPEKTVSNRSVGWPATDPVFALSYTEQIALWYKAEDLNTWIALNFGYDMNRAIALSASRQESSEGPDIYTPSELYTKKTGICVDLSRFAVESMREIDPESEPRYLMLKLEPVNIGGHWFENHWLACFRRLEKYFFFADTKRPGLITGPFESPEAFISEYQKFRRRTVVRFDLLSTYRRERRRARTKRRVGQTANNKCSNLPRRISE